jgi:hypothetical protein
MNASLILLVVMMVATAVIAVYRWIVAHHEDDFLHIQDPSGELVANQRQTARSLTRVDHIGIGLTVVTALYAVGLVFAFIYRGLN